ncbi:GNAT family N-acetyltransferase [Kiloniella antarctica]|uniref:GNAT family N-acetyltransferase n=1 Tax=Kiloniella antarctica TaxID=1550907 RepID=A0ABW5BHV3_9PROT
MDHSISTSRLIRKYKNSDLDAVLKCWESAFRLAHPFIEEAFVAKVRVDIPALYIPNAETWVCEERDLVVGFISLMGNEIAALFVDPKKHGQGNGRALVDKACAIREGKITVEVFELNMIGRKFYKTYGFEYRDQYVFEDVGETVLKLTLNESQLST